jgi:NTP pyrophosphatase (non-canonical NTP hydrolase)
MNITKVARAIAKISDVYAKKFGIRRDGNWYVLKLQEELGELTQSYLMMTGKARQKDKSKDQITEEFRKEVADVFCHVILLAKHYKVNLEKEVTAKWLVYDQNKPDLS